jgi:hypothetical protein
MDGYTWTFSENTVHIFLDGKLWGAVVDTTEQGLPDWSFENLSGLLPDHIVEAIKADPLRRLCLVPNASRAACGPMPADQPT